MDGHLFIAQGDLVELSADAIAYSTSTELLSSGDLFASFHEGIPGFTAWFESLRQDGPRSRQVGETYWMPIEKRGRPHGVVVVISTGGPQTEEDKAAIAVRVAVNEAVPRLRTDLGLTGRLLIALPAFRTGRGGDHDYLFRSARAQVASAIECLAQFPGTGIAFVAYTPAIYRVFLEARREIVGQPVTMPDLPTGLEEALVNQECVLFIGAGLSRGAGLPDWSQLVDRMADALGVKRRDRLDFLDLAQWYRERFSQRAITELIGTTLFDPAHASRPTLAQLLVASLPVRIIITTNYDDLIERALGGLKRFPVKVVRDSDVARTGWHDGVHVVKLHGDATAADEIVLCRDDYDEFFERRPAMALLLEGLLLNQTFFFIGYSLRDPNFRQVFSKIARMLRDARRPAFATNLDSAADGDSYQVQQWRTKQLHLLGVPGADQSDRERNLLIFLDALADRVALRSPHLFLERDVETSPALAPIRKLLLNAGDELVRLYREHALRPGSGRDIHHLGSLLRFLSEHGWRPRRESRIGVCRLWIQLASHTEDLSEKRRLLIAALGTAEGSDDARRIREQLAALGKSDT